MQINIRAKQAKKLDITRNEKRGIFTFQFYFARLPVDTLAHTEIWRVERLFWRGQHQSSRFTSATTLDVTHRK